MRLEQCSERENTCLWVRGHTCTIWSRRTFTCTIWFR